MSKKCVAIRDHWVRVDKAPGSPSSNNLVLLNEVGEGEDVELYTTDIDKAECVVCGELVMESDCLPTDF